MKTHASFRVSSMLAVLTALTALTMASAGAQAVSSYGNLAAPGVYFGAGRANGDRNIGSAAGIELGLRVEDATELPPARRLDRHLLCRCRTHAGGGVKTQWNHEFLVNIGNLSYQGLTFKLDVDHDPSAGTNYAYVNPQTYWFDNATVTLGANGSNGFQNSQTSASAARPVARSTSARTGRTAFRWRCSMPPA